MGIFGFFKRAALKPVPNAVIVSRNPFLECVTHILSEEGGYVDDPQDSGGATNRGITQATLAHFRGRPVTEQEVRDLTEAEARVIYRANYWNAVRGDDLPLGVDLCVFDAAVNSGPGRVAKWLQIAAGVSNVDGAIGPLTLAQVKRKPAQQIIESFCDQRRVFVRQAKGWPRFGKGWTARILRIEDKSMLRVTSN